MIFGTGIDIVSVDRFRNIIDKNNEGLLKRLFTPFELENCMNKAVSPQKLAARFAAKEALFKAFGTGLSHGISWQDIEVANDESGKPFFKVYGESLRFIEKNSITGISLSISHESSYAAAMVILEKTG